jgi:hypothetical protein
VAAKKNADREKAPRVIPGMRSDLDPRPKEDPDFGPGMEYESGDLNPDFSEADKIREQWKKPSKEQQPAPQPRRRKRKSE